MVNWDMRRKYDYVWNGQEYRNIEAMRQALGITSRAVIYRLKMGYTCDSDMKYKRLPRLARKRETDKRNWMKAAFERSGIKP